MFPVWQHAKIILQLIRPAEWRKIDIEPRLALINEHIKLAFLRLAFVRKRRLTARRSSVHFPVLFVRCWLWCITCCSRANERAVIADCNFTSSDSSLMADCHIRFGDPFFSYFPVFVRFDDKTEEPHVCYSVVKRQGGRKKNEAKRRKRKDRG